MVNLRIDGNYLDLARNTALTITLHNPAFDRDGSEALYSFPFKLPATPNNISMLEAAQRLDNASNNTTFVNAVLEIAGIPFDHGQLELDKNSFSAGQIGATYKQTTPEFWEVLEKVDIRETVETVSSQLNPPAAFWSYSLSIPPDTGITYKIIIAGNTFSYTAPGAVVPEAVIGALAIAIEATFPGLADQATSTILKLNSSEVNSYAPDHLTLENLTFDGAVTEGQASFRGLLSHANSINAAASASHRFPVIYWQQFFLGRVANFSNRINPILEEESDENLPAETATDWTTSFLPFVTVPYLLDRIALSAPSVFTGWSGWLKDSPDAQGLLLFNNRSIDRVYLERFPNVAPLRYLNGVKTNIRLADHLPDINAKTFLQSLLSTFGLWIKIIGTSIKLIKKTDQLTAAPIDWTSLSEPEYSATRNRRRGYVLQYQTIEDEDRAFVNQVYDPQLNAFVSGEGFKENPLPLNSLRTDNSVVIRKAGDPIGKMPAVQQAGSSDEGGVGSNEYSLRLFFYRGLQAAANGDTYPMASHDHSDHLGTAIGSLSFDLNDLVFGLYKQHHQGLIDLQANGQAVKIATRLSIQDILQARRWENSKRMVALAGGQMVGIIKSIQFKVSMKGLSVSIVEYLQEK